MKKILILVSCLLTLLSTSTMSFGYEDGEWQYWPRVSIEGKIANKW